MSNIKVAVGLSGGVDSSVAAALLKERGFRVTGVTMKLWDGPSSSSVGGRHGCYGPGEEEDIEDARQVAARLGIPLLVIDLSAEYRTEVLDYFRSEYRSGRTPNPCSRCNRSIKFGTLVKKVRESGTFDYFATGHYAKVQRRESDRRYLLRKGKDLGKDQSYFLALLSQDQLSHALFPLGDYMKTEVRALAEKFDLPVARKAESQDFVDTGCDLATDTMNPGPILDRQGRELGRHSGIARHTIGQRKGLGISSDRPLYVAEIDPARNAVIVGERSEIFGSSLVATQLNWIARGGIDSPIDVKARIRYRHQEAGAHVKPSGQDSALVEFEEPQMAIAPGQTIVFYEDDIVVGGGIIDRTKE
jgi:tRNA-specific 2-thiouridylase